MMNNWIAANAAIHAESRRRMTSRQPTDAEMVAMIMAEPGDRYTVTVRIASKIREMGYRFDKSWRHAEEGPKAEAYARCCTFAANDIADDPSQSNHWGAYL